MQSHVLPSVACLGKPSVAGRSVPWSIFCQHSLCRLSRYESAWDSLYWKMVPRPVGLFQTYLQTTLPMDLNMTNIPERSTLAWPEHVSLNGLLARSSHGLACRRGGVYSMLLGCFCQYVCTMANMQSASICELLGVEQVAF